MVSEELIAECARLSLEERVIYLPNNRTRIYGHVTRNSDQLNVRYQKLPGFAVETPVRTEEAVPPGVEVVVYSLLGRNMGSVSVPNVMRKSRSRSNEYSAREYSAR